MRNSQLIKLNKMNVIDIIRKRVKSCRDEATPIESYFLRGMLDLIGSKWSSLLLIVLSERMRRFGELKRAVPVYHNGY